MSDTGTPSGALARSRSGMTSTTSAEALQLQELSLNTRILSTVNPWMNGRPDVLLELAGSGLGPDEIASQGAALYGMQNMSSLRDSLGGLSPVAQRSVYGKLTETQQRALQQMGYRQPDDPDGGSMLGGALGAFGDIVEPVWSGVSNVGGPVIGGALDVLTWVGDQPAHLYRAIRQMDSWQQWVALGGAAAGLALAPVTFGGSLAVSGTLISAGILGGSALAGATIAAAATNPAEWWEALNATWDGERVFERGAQRRARELLGGDELNAMAKEIALEIDPYQLATEVAGQRGGGQQQLLDTVQKVAARIVDPGSAEYERVYGGLVALTQQEPFLDAVDTLQRGKISFGRDIADAAGLSGAEHSVISGMLDGVWLMSMDPTLAAGKIVNLGRIRKYGVTADGGEAFMTRLTHLSNTDAATRANHEAIAQAVTTGDFTMMPTEARGLWNSLQEYRRSVSLLDDAGEQTDEFTRRHLLEYFEHGDGIRRLLEGKSTIRGIEQAVISRRNESRGWGRFVREAREFRNALDDVELEHQLRGIANEIGVSDDLDELLPANVLDELIHTEIAPIGDVAERAAGQTGQALGSMLGVRATGKTLGAFLGSITSMVPANKAIRIVGEGSEVDIPRFVEMMGRATNLPSGVRDRWLNAIMNQGAANQRITVIESFMNTALDAAGMRSNTELAELADQFVRKFRQGYALGGLDETAAGIKAGVLPDSHQASLIVLPDLTEMQKAVRRGHILKNVARVSDSNFVEASMSRFWKPAVLMRIGFIPRAAGEEALAWAMRMTEGGVGAEFGARSLAMHDAYDDAVRAVNAGKIPTGAQIEALNWQLPTHVRPLARMFSRVGWQDPVESMLDNYGRTMRAFLEEGVGRAIDDVVVETGRTVGVGRFSFQATRSAQWHHGLLYGRQHSWRRLVANGVDPTLRKAADTWVLAHADSLMRATSSMNASVFEKSIVNPDVDHFMVEDPKNPGKLIEEPMITHRGERQRVGQSDPRYAAAVSHRMAEAWDDDIVGPALARMYPHFFPGFADLQPANVVEAVEISRNAQSWEARMILSEALQPREDNWRAAAQVIRRRNEDAAAAIEDALLYGDVSWQRIIDSLDATIAGLDPKADLQRITELRALQQELTAVQPLVDGMATLGVDSQAWMAQALSADIAKPGGFFDIDSMRTWRDGAGTETIAKRPERVWYRGVKDNSTLELRPNPETGKMDLVLKPQWQQGWNGDVISLSTLPDQSLGYAMSAESYNLPDQFKRGAFARGAMIEIDGDWVLNKYGTTMDEVNARPVRNHHKKGDVGVHYVEDGIDTGEISVVTSLNNQAFTLRENTIERFESQLADILDGDIDVAFMKMSDYDSSIREALESGEELTEFEQAVFDVVERIGHWDADNARDILEEAIVPLIEREIAKNKAELLAMGGPRPEQELVIPAGHWSIQTETEMENVLSSVAEIDSRWSWIENAEFRTSNGRSIEDLHTEYSTKVEQLLDGLDADQWGGYPVDRPEAADALNGLVEWMDSLPDDEFDVLQGIVGYRVITRRDQDAQVRGSEMYRMAKTILRDPDIHSRKFQSAIDLRGQGGFVTQQQGWTPFYSDRESFERALESEIYAQMLRPEHAESVRKSRFALETADGRKVAQPMQEGVQRIFQPVIGRNPRLDNLIERGMAEQFTDEQLVNWIVGELMGDATAYRTHPDFIRRLPEHQRAAALSDAVIAYLERADPRAGAWTAPMFGVGYDDPRIAQWVSDLVTGHRDSAPGVAYTDIPRTGVTGENPSGVIQSRELGDGGRTWRLSPERDGSVSMLDETGTVLMPDGSHAVGAAYTEAIADWARRIREKVMLEHGAGTREYYRPRSLTPNFDEFQDGVEFQPPELHRRTESGELVRLGHDERLGAREDLFDADGNPIDWADPRYFEAETQGKDGELLWAIIGPMARDYHEKRGGLATIVPKRFKEQVGGFRAGERAPEADQWVTMTRSRIDDVFRTRELDLPNVALSEVRTPSHDTLWDRIVRFGFDRVIGPSIDAMVRKPMTFHYYAQAYEQNQKWLSWMLDKNLFDTQIPRAFNLTSIDEATSLNPDQIADIRLLMDQFLYPAAPDDAAAAQWLVALGADDAEVIGELQKMSDAAARLHDDKLAAAAQRLMDIDTQPFRVFGAAGADGRASAERLVDGYLNAVPDNIWDDGLDAVNKHLADTKSVLPKLDNPDQWRMMRAATRNYQHTLDTVADTARLRALENVVPFLDSHEQRTQFATTTRNLLPFWYAEENFLKRWARTMSIDGTMGLATIRKAQLGYMGIKSAGIVRTDSNGNDWFVYPGSGLLGEAISKLPFVPDGLPTGVMFQASTDSLLPGVNERFGTPSVSPWVALPLDGVTTMFPDATPLKRAVLGDIGSSTGALKQFVPTQVQRVWEAAFGDEESSRRYASAMMSAAAMMEAEGNGLPDNASPELVDEYLDKLRNHARIIMWAQTMTGFVVPGSPIAINTGEDVGSFAWLTGMGVDSPDELVSTRYRSYIQNLGIDEGTSAFLRDFPNADLEDVINPLAYAVSTSSSPSAAPLPATRTGLAWYEQNNEWIDSMPEAGAWFLPPDPDGDFDFYAYNQQLVSGLRKQRNPRDFIRALKYRNAASGYFDARDQYEQAAIALGDDQERKRMLDDIWDSWRTSWLAAHPIFQEELVGGEARERRQRTIDQIRYAIDDPAAPDSPSKPAIAEMSRTFDTYRIALMRLNESRSAESREKVRQLKLIFDEWSAQWVLNNPELEQLWSAVYRPEASL